MGNSPTYVVQHGGGGGLLPGQRAGPMSKKPTGKLAPTGNLPT